MWRSIVERGQYGRGQYGHGQHGWRRVVIPATVSLAIAVIASHAGAQAALVPTDPANAITPAPAADSATVAAAWARADTGRMIPGYRDLSRYETPGMCLTAMERFERMTWRRGQADTLPQGTSSDTLPTNVRTLGQSCLAKMTVQSVDSMDRYDYVRLALRVGDTALARKGVEYDLAHMPVTSPAAIRTRGFVLADVMQAAVESHPAQYAFAESLLPLVVNMGKDAGEAVEAAYAMTIQGTLTRYDTAAYTRLIVEHGKLDRWMMFRDSINILYFRHDPTLPTNVQRLSDQMMVALAPHGVDSLLWLGNIAAWVKHAKITGTAAPTVNTLRRYPADVATAVPGHVTLVIGIPRIGEGHLEPYLAQLRRLYERYHSQGLDIVLVGVTQGYAWDSPPLAAEDEAKLIGWYYREYLKLPFPVLVEETKFMRIPDGRRIPQKSAFKYIFGREPVWPGYIVARNGTVADLNDAFHSEAMLDAFVVHELALPAR